MKGVVFKLFEAHVEKHLGEEILHDLLEIPELSTAGAYTSVGSYPHVDLLHMVGLLAEKTGISASELVHHFGTELFASLANAHPHITDKFSGCLEMLAGIETVIHRDVRKIYNDAEVPRFDVEAHEPDKRLVLVYQSQRPFADLAAGLIEGALKYFDIHGSAEIKRHNLKDDGTHARFEITLAA